MRALAWQLAQLLDKEPFFVGQEQPEALLSSAGQAHALFGYPQVPMGTVMGWVAEWVRADGPTLGKPTHYQVRDGRF